MNSDVPELLTRAYASGRVAPRQAGGSPRRAAPGIALAVMILAGTHLQLPSSFAETPPPDDPNVFLQFLDFNEHVNEEIVRLRTAGDRRAAENLEKAWQERLHLSAAGSAVVTSAYHELAAVLSREQLEANAYVSRTVANRRALDLPTIKSYEMSRVAAIRQAEESIRSALSPNDRLSLFGFINGEFRASAFRRPLK